MKHVQEKVFTTVTKWAYQTIGSPMMDIGRSMKKGEGLPIEVQALGTF